MLGVMCEPEYLGYYSNASRVVRASFGMVFAAIAVFNPRLNYLYKTENRDEYRMMFQRFYDVGMYLAIPAATGLFAFAPWVMTLMFGEAFAPGIFTLRLLSFLIIIFTFASVFGHVGLIIYGKEKYLLIAAVAGAVINFMLNRILIPSYMHQGAAMASLISECLITILLVAVSMKCCKVQLFNRRLAALSAFCVALCVGSLLISYL
jgi:O-antigen/teichoic acid export membrane protein